MSKAGDLAFSTELGTGGVTSARFFGWTWMEFASKLPTNEENVQHFRGVSAGILAANSGFFFGKVYAPSITAAFC